MPMHVRREEIAVARAEGVPAAPQQLLSKRNCPDMNLPILIADGQKRG